MEQRPDPLESTPPAFGTEAARQILREGFGVEPSSLKPLAGERDQNFRVDAAGGQRFLLKISNPADDGPILAMQAAALRHIELVDPGLPVMRALPTTAGEGWLEVPGPDGRVCPARLFTFLPGQVMLNTELTTAAFWSVGRSRLGWDGLCVAFSTPRPTTRSCGISPAQLSSAPYSPTSPTTGAGLRWNGFSIGLTPGLFRRCQGFAHK